MNYILGIANPAIKATLAGLLGDRPTPILVHPNSSMGFDVEIGPGTVICAGVHMTTNIRIGRHVSVNRGSTIGHDVAIGDYTSINPLVGVSGNVTIGPQVMLGTHSCVLQGLDIGINSTIGAAALVTQNVHAGSVMKGVPAR